MRAWDLAKFTAASLLACLVVEARAADPIFPNGASVGLVPPPGMSLSKAFSGFEHRSGASVVIAELPAEAYPQLVEKFSRKALNGLARIRDVTVSDETSTQRDGATTIRLRGAGTEAESGRPVQVTQTILFGPTRYLRIVGLAPPEKAEALLRAERVADAVEPR